MRVREFIENETIRNNIRMTVDYILGRQLDNGHVVDNQPGMEDRVQWCHGAPAAIPVFIQAYKTLGDEKYLIAAQKAADYTFKFGVISKGVTLCHGVASNIYMLAQLYSVTKDPRYKYYITELLKFALDTPKLTKPSEFVNYDCTGTFSSFNDTPSSAIAFFSDFLSALKWDGLDNVWMIGFGDIYPQMNHLRASAS